MPRNNFNFIAPYYDQLVSVVFQNNLYRAQTHFITKNLQSNSILILGGGTGKIISPCVDLNTQPHIHYIESSKKMLEQAKRHVLKHHPEKIDRINFENGDILKLDPTKKYDLILLPFILDLFSEKEVEFVLKSLKNKLMTKGKIIFTDFYSTPKSSRIFRLSIYLMYLFFGVVAKVRIQRLPHFDKAFSGAGYKKTDQQIFINGLLQTCVYEVPQSKRKIMM